MGVRTMQGGCRGTTMVRGARAGRGTGREARKRGSWNNAVRGHRSRELGALRGCTRDWEYASQTMTLTVLAGLQPQAENWTRAGGYSCI